MTDIRLENGFDYNGAAGSELLDANVIETMDQTDLLPDYKMYKALLDVTMVPIINPSQKYGAKYANGWLQKKEERGNKAERALNFWPKKWIYQEVFSEKFSMSEELTEWIRSSNTIAWAPEGIQAEYVSIAEQMQDLVEWYDITWADLLVRLYTKWFVMTASEGPGSPTAKGVALFGTHTLLNGETFSNLYGTTIDYDNATEATAIASGKTALQSMLNSLKWFTNDNGRKIRQTGWKGYNLYCSRIRETFWLQVLNDGSDQSGRGENSAEKNQFKFRNNNVNLKVIDTLWDLDEVTGENIGNNDMVFTTNPEYLRKQKAFKCYELYSPKIKNWMNEDTDEIFNSLKCSIWADHYYAEYWIIWYAG